MSTQQDDPIAYTCSLDELAVRDYQQYVLHDRALQQAMKFLYDHEWCDSVLSARFGCGVGGVFAVFLIEIENTASPQDSLLWVIQGDLPPAYFVTPDVRTPSEALEAYIDHLEDLIETASAGLATDECMPIDKPISADTLRALSTRLAMLRTFLRTMG